MKQIVPIDLAIKKGHRMINYPMVFLFWVIFIIGLVSFDTNFENILLKILWLISILFIPLLYRCFYIPKWKVWAFENVRNVHELKKRAIQEHILYDDDSIFKKFEIFTFEDKAKWTLIQDKFSITDIFEDDQNIPSEIKIYYSKTKNLRFIVIMCALISLGLLSILSSKEYLFGAAFLVVGLYFGYNYFKFALNTKPQIILNKFGIETVSAKLIGWNEIWDEKVICEGSGKHSKYYLTYKYENGEEKLIIDNFATNQIKLEKLMQIYRGRNIIENNIR
ncbi:hypothetical protein [Flavobacterium sp.]|uniref:hypothetical protein n=1 Tax=Flavobacterium sp. TaxID=239 RepID=UPI0040482AD0